jgi:hypothetical protein
MTGIAAEHHLIHTRRHFLRSSSALIALPVLESLGFRRFASAAPVMRPKRMVLLGFGWGVTKESWYPDKNTVGADYTLPPGLAPLKRNRQDLTVIQNLANPFRRAQGQHLLAHGREPFCRSRPELSQQHFRRPSRR